MKATPITHFFIASMIVLLMSGCMYPSTTCTPCSYYQLPLNAIALFDFTIHSNKKSSSQKYTGEKEIFLHKPGEYIMHFKQCPNVKYFDVWVKIYSISKDKHDELIAQFECINIQEMYKVFVLESPTRCKIVVNTSRKLMVDLKLGILPGKN